MQQSRGRRLGACSNASSRIVPSSVSSSWQWAELLTLHNGRHGADILFPSPLGDSFRQSLVWYAWEHAELIVCIEVYSLPIIRSTGP